MMKKNKGFTLLELLVVITVVAVISVAGVGLFYQALRGGGKAQALKELDQNAQLVINLMEFHIRNARDIVDVSGADCPATGDSLSITGFDGLVTTYDLTAEGKIASNGAEISSQSVEVTNLVFECTRQTGTPDQVMITFTVGYKVGTEVIDERDYTSVVGLRNY